MFISRGFRFISSSSPSLFSLSGRYFSSSSPSSSPSSPPSLPFVSEFLQFSIRPYAYEIYFNRPTVHNAFNEKVINEVKLTFDYISRITTENNNNNNNTNNTNNYSSPRAVILSGRGASFSAGADLQWMAKMKNYSKEENEKDAVALFDMINSIARCPLPVIARVNGAALGGGSGIVAASDIVISVDNAIFGFTEVRLGLAPAVISRFVYDKIGRSASSYYFLTGKRFDAKEAKRIGLVQMTVPDEKALDDAVNEIINELSQNSPAGMRASKQLISTISALPDAPSTKEYVTKLIAGLRVSPEGQEGTTSFLEKRRPFWNLKKTDEKKK